MGKEERPLRPPSHHIPMCLLTGRLITRRQTQRHARQPPPLPLGLSAGRRGGLGRPVSRRRPLGAAAPRGLARAEEIAAACLSTLGAGRVGSNACQNKEWRTRRDATEQGMRLRRAESYKGASEIRFHQ